MHFSNKLPCIYLSCRTALKIMVRNESSSLTSLSKATEECSHFPHSMLLLIHWYPAGCIHGSFPESSIERVFVYCQRPASDKFLKSLAGFHLRDFTLDYCVTS